MRALELAHRRRRSGTRPDPSSARDATATPTDLRLLRVLVFVVGVSTLGAEIAAARLMAPFFGASTIVWANTIGTVLVALSIGYWLGGRLADRRPHLARLARWVLGASVLLALVPLVADPFLALSVGAFDDIDVGAASARSSACSRWSPCRCCCSGRCRRGRSA